MSSIQNTLDIYVRPFQTKMGMGHRLLLGSRVLGVASQLHHVTENATCVQIIPISSCMHFQLHHIS